MFKRNLIHVWVGIICLSGMFLMGQESWYPKDFTKFSTLVTMTDGTRIAVDAFIPTNCTEPCQPPFPTVFEYLPYQRATADPYSNLVLDAISPKSRLPCSSIQFTGI